MASEHSPTEAIDEWMEAALDESPAHYGVRVPPSVHARAKSIVNAGIERYKPGVAVPPYTSLTELYTHALVSHVVAVEERYNGGQPFPAADGPLRTGPGRSGRWRLSRQRQRADETKPVDD